MLYIKQKEYGANFHSRHRSLLDPPWHPIRKPLAVFPFTKEVTTFCGKIIPAQSEKHEIKEIDTVPQNMCGGCLKRQEPLKVRGSWATSGYTVK